MKTFKRIILIALVAGLVAAKLFLPDVVAAVRQKAIDALVLDKDYRAVFQELGNRLAGQEQELPAETDQVTSETAAGVRGVPEPELVRYYIEEAATLGETIPAPEPEPELPAAVSAFLESQAVFSDHALPENVDYGYEALPFDYAIPVSGYNSSGFGYRLHPILNEVKFHYGTDFAANAGEDVCAFADGTVTFAGYSDSYGYYVTIDHGGGWTSLYAHCSKLYAQTGQTVAAGEKIALVGATGLATGPHLHFELRLDGVYHNPEYYVN